MIKCQPPGYPGGFSSFSPALPLALGDGLQLDPEYGASRLTLVTTAVPPPPGGAASSSAGRHSPGLSEVAFSSLQGNANGGALGQGDAAAPHGKMARDNLDMFFQLLADRADYGSELLGV